MTEWHVHLKFKDEDNKAAWLDMNNMQPILCTPSDKPFLYQGRVGNYIGTLSVPVNDVLTGSLQIESVDER